MTIRLTRNIPVDNDDGSSVYIPGPAWSDIQEIARTEFGIDLDISYEPTLGRFRELMTKHYRLSTQLDPMVADAFMTRMGPLIDDVVERHTQPAAHPER